jgi:hypothetical protein
VSVDVLAGSAGVANLVGSAVIVALGLLVLLPAPRGRPQRSFALLACGIGVGAGASNLVFSDPDWTTAMWAVLAVGHVVSLVGLVGVVGSVTGPLTGKARIVAAAAFTVVAATMHVGYFLDPGPQQGFAALGYPVTPALVPGTSVATLFFSACWAAAFVLARWAARPGPHDSRHAALLSSSLLVYPAAIATQAPGSGFPVWDWLALGSMLAAGVVSVAWLAASRQGAGRAMLAAAWAPLAIVVLGLLSGASQVQWVGGASRIAMTVLVAFAILRYHALGIHATLRFGISKGTVAGIVVAVFFIASEAAQQFFGATLQNEYVGIVAAGLLVFAIAPLSRVADRIAEAAVPSGLAPGGAAADDARADLRRAYAAAARDGRITHEEELALARLATRLGLDAAEVLEIRRDALAAVSGGARR